MNCGRLPKTHFFELLVIVMCFASSVNHRYTFKVMTPFSYHHFVLFYNRYTKLKLYTVIPKIVE